MSSFITASPISPDSQTAAAEVLSVALIGPDDLMRATISSALEKAHRGPCKIFSNYPEIGDLPRFLKQQFDVMIIGCDADPASVLKLVEAICASGNETVFVYSEHFSSDRMMQCMRAGVREYLTQELTVPMLQEALGRIHSRKTLSGFAKKTNGKVFSFLGVKGGLGTTTLAVNFAVALAAEVETKTLLIDLDLPLGDAALSLGINAQYSTVDALKNVGRLDANFLQSLLVKHGSGLSILSAPSQLSESFLPTEAINRLIAVAKEEFDYIVIDLGTRLDLRGTEILSAISTMYLVTQAGVTELRNANRALTEFSSFGGPKIEIVLNRSTARTFGIDESHIEKALGRSVQWRIPDDYGTAKKSQNAAAVIITTDSVIARSLRHMADTASNKPIHKEKKKYLGLFSSKQ